MRRRPLPSTRTSPQADSCSLRVAALHLSSRHNLRCQYSAPAPISCAWTSPPRSTATSRSPICRPATSKSPRMTCRRPSRRSSSCASTAPGPSNLDEPLAIRSKQHAILEAAREDVRLFALFLDDYHIDKRPDITLPLRDTLTKFIKQLGPNDLVALMDPLTTLYDLKYTRAKDDCCSGFAPSRAGAARPIPSRAPSKRRNSRSATGSSCAPVSRSRRSRHWPRRWAACVKAASRSCSSARARRCRRAVPMKRGIARPSKRPIAATSPST